MLFRKPSVDTTRPVPVVRPSSSPAPVGTGGSVTTPGHPCETRVLPRPTRCPVSGKSGPTTLGHPRHGSCPYLMRDLVSGTSGSVDHDLTTEGPVTLDDTTPFSFYPLLPPLSSDPVPSPPSSLFLLLPSFPPSLYPIRLGSDSPTGTDPHHSPGTRQRPSSSYRSKEKRSPFTTVHHSCLTAPVQIYTPVGLLRPPPQPFRP